MYRHRHHHPLARSPTERGISTGTCDHDWAYASASRARSNIHALYIRARLLRGLLAELFH
jgi:hypothetical protein